MVFQDQEESRSVRIPVAMHGCRQWGGGGGGGQGGPLPPPPPPPQFFRQLNCHSAGNFHCCLQSWPTQVAIDLLALTLDLYIEYCALISN